MSFLIGFQSMFSHEYHPFNYYPYKKIVSINGSYCLRIYTSVLWVVSDNDLSKGKRRVYNELGLKEYEMDPSELEEFRIHLEESKATLQKNVELTELKTQQTQQINANDNSNETKSEISLGGIIEVAGFFSFSSPVEISKVYSVTIDGNTDSFVIRKYMSMRWCVKGFNSLSPEYKVETNSMIFENGEFVSGGNNLTISSMNIEQCREFNIEICKFLKKEIKQIFLNSNLLLQPLAGIVTEYSVSEPELKLENFLLANRFVISDKPSTITMVIPTTHCNNRQEWRKIVDVTFRDGLSFCSSYVVFNNTNTNTTTTIRKLNKEEKCPKSTLNLTDESPYDLKDIGTKLHSGRLNLWSFDNKNGKNILNREISANSVYRP